MPLPRGKQMLKAAQAKNKRKQQAAAASAADRHKALEVLLPRPQTSEQESDKDTQIGSPMKASSVTSSSGSSLYPLNKGDFKNKEEEKKFREEREILKVSVQGSDVPSLKSLEKPILRRSDIPNQDSSQMPSFDQTPVHDDPIAKVRRKLSFGESKTPPPADQNIVDLLYDESVETFSSPENPSLASPPAMETSDTGGQEQSITQSTSPTSTSQNPQEGQESVIQLCKCETTNHKCVICKEIACNFCTIPHPKEDDDLIRCHRECFQSLQQSQSPQVGLNLSLLMEEMTKSPQNGQTSPIEEGTTGASQQPETSQPEGLVSNYNFKINN